MSRTHGSLARVETGSSPRRGEVISLRPAPRLAHEQPPQGGGINPNIGRQSPLDEAHSQLPRGKSIIPVQIAFITDVPVDPQVLGYMQGQPESSNLTFNTASWTEAPSHLQRNPHVGLAVVYKKDGNDPVALLKELRVVNPQLKTIYVGSENPSGFDLCLNAHIDVDVLYSRIVSLLSNGDSALAAVSPSGALFQEALSLSSAEFAVEANMKAKRKALAAKYNQLTQEQRGIFFGAAYDKFADTYDRFMAEETNHYGAMDVLLDIAVDRGFVRFPVIDLSAGTGHPLLHMLTRIERVIVEGRMQTFLDRNSDTDLLPPLNGDLTGIIPDRYKKGLSSGLKDLKNEREFTSRLLDVRANLRNLFTGTQSMKYLVVVNEIAKRMRAVAETQFDERGYWDFTKFTTFNACSPHYKFTRKYGGKFQTVLSAQTLHLISRQDKEALVDTMAALLAPGGHALILEERRFSLTQTPGIAPVSFIISSIAQPIDESGLIGLFQRKGRFELDRSRFVWPIDEKDGHEFRLYRFMRTDAA